MKRTVDLRSDTVTKPTPGMRGAMMDAEVGDDVFGEDPTVNALQEKVAKLLNKEAALFVCLENTHNRAGGRVYPLEKIRETHSLAKRYGLAMHLDGARLMNASVAMGIPPDSYARYFDSVSIYLSKGLGAPIGSIIGGTREFIDRVHRFRK